MILTKEQVDGCFENARDQSEAFVALYKLVIPEWDRVDKIKGWPKAGKEVDAYIFKKFIEYDGNHHPNVIKGGMWMNSGWSSGEGLEDWEVTVDPEIIKYKEVS